MPCAAFPADHPLGQREASPQTLCAVPSAELTARFQTDPASGLSAPLWNVEFGRIGSRRPEGMTGQEDPVMTLCWRDVKVPL